MVVVNGAFALHATIGSCDPIAINDAKSGGMLIPTGVTGLVFNACDTAAGTYAPIHDSTNTAVAPTVTAGKRFTWPAAIFSHAFIKIQSAGANASANVTLNN